jgi:outer membrane protein assembly factor BamD
LLLLTACSEYTNVLKTGDYEYRYEAAKALYVEGHYRQAAEIFSMLLAPLKGTVYGEECLYMLGETNLRAKDYEAAAMYFKKYYQAYPKGHYMELARYYTGYALYMQTPDLRLDQTSTMEAINEFQNFIDYCPGTSLMPQAQEIIYALQDKLVEKELLSAQLYYDLGGYIGNATYGGSNYAACVVTAQNALKDYPYASAKLREELSILVLRAKYYLARRSVEERRLERFRDTVDEYYAFVSDYPESRYMKEANAIFQYSERIVDKKGGQPDEDNLSKKKKVDDAEKALREIEEKNETKEKTEKQKQDAFFGNILRDVLRRK